MGTTTKLLILVQALLMIGCGRQDYEVSQYLTEKEVDEFKRSIVRYVSPLPKKANDLTKFEPRFEAHYQKQMRLVRLDKYYPSKDGYIYFETSRIAPSFKVKRVATGGRLKYGPESDIVEYEEAYRTWKMEEEPLNHKTKVLFSAMVDGDDLTPYYGENSAEEYIEFPDHSVRYDKALRRWTGNETVTGAQP